VILENLFRRLEQMISDIDTMSHGTRHEKFILATNAILPKHMKDEIIDTILRMKAQKTMTEMQSKLKEGAVVDSAASY
jgi:hypothetical protein